MSITFVTETAQTIQRNEEDSALKQTEKTITFFKVGIGFNTYYVIPTTH